MSASLVAVLCAERLGDSLLSWHDIASIAIVIILPVSVLAQESAGAMLRTSGVGVLINKNPAPPSIALYRNDLVETQKGSAARFETTGSSTDINPETMVQVQANELVLDHGSLSVNTSRGLTVKVGCLAITPVDGSSWTQYEVIDVDAKVTILARKGDVYIDARSSALQEARRSEKSSRSIVRESEQKTRDEKCAAVPDRPQGVVAGPGAILNSRWAILAGAPAAGTIACLGLCHDDDPISPAQP